MGVIVNRAFCLDLATAGMVIGFLGILGGVWEILETLIGLVYFDDYYGNMSEEVQSTAYIILIVMVVVCLVDLLSAVLLMLGIQKKSSKLLLPWLIIKGIALAILIPISSLTILYGMYFVINGMGGLVLIKAFILLIATVLYAYLFVIIYSLYHYIRDESQKPHLIDAEKLYSNSNVQYYKT